MNRRIFTILTFVLTALLMMYPAVAQAQSAIEVSLVPESDGMTVGDPIRLTLVVKHPADQHVILPQLDSNWGDFVVHSQSVPTTADNPDGTKTTSQVIDVRLFAPGEFSTPEFSVTVADSAGQLSEVAVPPVSLLINSVLVEGDTELRDIKPQAALPYRNWLPWLAAGFLAAAMIGGVFWMRRRRVRLALAEVDNRLPHEVALDELERIEGLRLPDKAHFKDYYTLVSDCVRVYMEKTYQIPVLERTTGEIRTSLKGTQVKPEIVIRFVTFLDDSDLVKFSKFIPTVGNAQELMTQARQIIDETNPEPVPLDPDTGSAPTDGVAPGRKVPARAGNQQIEVTA